LLLVAEVVEGPLEVPGEAGVVVAASAGKTTYL
jgi:hypothetical protein